MNFWQPLKVDQINVLPLLMDFFLIKNKLRGCHIESCKLTFLNCLTVIFNLFYCWAVKVSNNFGCEIEVLKLKFYRLVLFRIYTQTVNMLIVCNNCAVWLTFMHLT